MTFGAHQSIGGGICNAITRGQEATCDAIQIFNKSSNQWRARPLGDEEVESFLELVEETGIAVVCSHVSYLINLASPDPALSRKSLASLKEEVKRCGRLQIPNLVLHPGAHVGSGEEKGIERIAENLNRLIHDSLGCLGGKRLGHRRFQRHAVSASILLPGRAIDQ